MSNHRVLPQKLEIDGIAFLLGRRVAALLVPVFVCMAVVSWSAISLSPMLGGDNIRPFFAFFDENKQDTISKKIGLSLVNALITIGFVTLVTFLVALLYKYRCMKTLFALLIFSAASTLFLMMWIWLDLFCTRFQIPYDFLTATFLLWNVGVVGLLSIFYHSHPVLSQVYLVVVSIIAGWALSFLPEWTTWLILIFIALYDVVAVLCPWGPLRMLIEISHQRNESIPGLLYDSENQITVPPPTAGITPEPSSSLSPSLIAVNCTNEAATEEPSVNVDQEREGARTVPISRRRQKSSPAFLLYYRLYIGPFKLGLGDFVFYSLLTARAAMYSFMPFMMSTIAIMVGLVGTLASLVLFRGRVSALPALPISIACGVFVFFLCRYVVVPFDWYLTSSMLVI